MYVKRFAVLIQTNPLMLCSETMPAYCQEPTQFCGPGGLQVRNSNPGGTSSYHWEFNS